MSKRIIDRILKIISENKKRLKFILIGIIFFTSLIISDMIFYGHLKNSVIVLIVGIISTLITSFIGKGNNNTK